MNTEFYTIRRPYDIAIDFDKIAEMYMEKYEGNNPSEDDLRPTFEEYINKYHSREIWEDLDDCENDCVYDDILEDALYHTRQKITLTKRRNECEKDTTQMKELDKFLHDVCTTNEKCQNCRLIHADNTCVFACECMKHNFHNYTPSIF